MWAVKENVTTGVTENLFAPEGACSRAEAVTFLYRVFGKPAASGEMPFEDVKEGDWYYDAVLWAVQAGVTIGTDDTHFSPALTVTRGQFVTMMYRADKASASPDNAFTDVDSEDFYASAVTWAAEKGITLGIGGDLFGPEDPCLRAQIVTLLYRDYGAEE